MTNQQGAPEALRLADLLLLSSALPGSVSECAGIELRRLHAENERLAALVEAQQPAAHVQNPAEIEHVAGDVSKNGPGSNMAQQPAPSAAAAQWWRSRADEIEAQVAATGSSEAMRCYTDMRTLLQAATNQPSPTPQADSARDEFISREQWVEKAMRVYLIAGDTEDEARECAEYQWGELDMDDIPDPYFTAMEDIEGRGPAPQADSQPAPDEIINMAREQGLPETEIEGVFRVNVDDLGRMFAADRAARAPADSVTAPTGGLVAGRSVTVGPVGLEWLIAEINKLPTVSASEIDGEESDGTPRHWRNRPHVSLRKLERLLREFFTPPPADAAPTPPPQAADTVLEDAAPSVEATAKALAWVETTPEYREKTRKRAKAMIDAARKQGGKP